MIDAVNSGAVNLGSPLGAAAPQGRAAPSAPSPGTTVAEGTKPPTTINGVPQGGTPNPPEFTPSGEGGDSVARQFTDAVVNFIQGGVKQPAPAKPSATGGGAVTLNPDALPKLPTSPAPSGTVDDPGPDSPTSTSSETVAVPPKDLQPVSLDPNIGGSVIGQPIEELREATTDTIIDATPTLSTFTKSTIKDGTSLTSISSIDSNIANVSPIRCASGYTSRDIVATEPVPSFCNGNVVCSLDNAAAGCTGFVCEFTGGTCSEGLVATPTAVGQYICKAPEKVCAASGEFQTTCNTDAIQAALTALNENIIKASDGSTGFTAKEGANLCQPGYELALGFIHSTESFGYFCNASPLNVCNASGTRLVGTSSTEACCAF